MSHELRTPLNAIIGFSEIMESGMFGALGCRQISTNIASDIHRSGEYLLDVINDILDMSKIEAGRLKLDLESVELDRELSDALRVVTARAQEKKLKITSQDRVRHPPDAPTGARSSRSRSISCPTP